MSKVLDCVSRALRILRVTDVNDVPAPEDMATAIVALNGMMRRWEADGLALGWAPVSEPDDTLPVPPEAEEAVAFNLALRLRPEYGVTLDPDTVQWAERGFSDLLRDRLTSAPLRLRARSMGGCHYNIYVDDCR